MPYPILTKATSMKNGHGVGYDLETKTLVLLNAWGDIGAWRPVDVDVYRRFPPNDTCVTFIAEHLQGRYLFETCTHATSADSIRRVASAIMVEQKKDKLWTAKNVVVTLDTKTGRMKTKNLSEDGASS